MVAFCLVIVFIIYAYNTSNKMKKLEQENSKLKKQLKKVREMIETQENKSKIVSYVTQNAENVGKTEIEENQ